MDFDSVSCSGVNDRPVSDVAEEVLSLCVCCCVVVVLLLCCCCDDDRRMVE